jgi:hypothetical protein
MNPGFEAPFYRIEKLRPGIKVLLMSGYTDNVTEVKEHAQKRDRHGIAPCVTMRRRAANVRDCGSSHLARHQHAINNRRQEAPAIASSAKRETAPERATPSLSKHELRSYLNQPGRRRTNDVAERCAANIAVNGLRSKELSVVKNVEGFEPELDRFGFAKPQVLEKRHIEVLYSGAMEITP